MVQKAHSLSLTNMFTPKYRRKVIYNQYWSSLGKIFHRLCSYKGVEIIEGHLMPDHVHILVSIPPRISVSTFMKWYQSLFDRLQITDWQLQIPQPEHLLYDVLEMLVLLCKSYILDDVHHGSLEEELLNQTPYIFTNYSKQLFYCNLADPWFLYNSFLLNENK